VQNVKQNFHLCSSDCIAVAVPISHSWPANPPTAMAIVSDLHTAEADSHTPPLAAATLNVAATDTRADAPPPIASPSHPKSEVKCRQTHRHPPHP
jgi:hypothetical protein